MSNKLAGAIFILFGMSLLGSSVKDLLSNSEGVNNESIKSTLGLILGISSSIYGYLRMKVEDTTPSE